MKIYVAAEEALRKKERGDETQFTTKIGGKTSLDFTEFTIISLCKHHVSLLVNIIHYYNLL